MATVEGYTTLSIPVSEVWRTFLDVGQWHTWNRCFFRAWVRGGRLREGATLIWFFNPIKPYYLYKMFATAKIVEFVPEQKVTMGSERPSGFPCQA